jgi:diphthine synthase
MFCLVGLGIWDEKDISVRGVEACRKADEIYAELYTAAWGGSLEELGRMIGKKVVPLDRAKVEEESEKLIKKAKDRNVVLLIPGDPLVATTHVHLVSEAREKGVACEVVHSSSILTVIGRTGLQLYKFGRVVSIPTPQKNYSPESFFDGIKKNQESGLHTLLLLDWNMDTEKAMQVLAEIEKKRKVKVLKGRKVVLCSRLGSKDERIVYGKFEKLAKTKLPPPAVMIVPGKLHFTEKEFLERL